MPIDYSTESKFNPLSLKQFNPALVYEFEAEASIRPERQDRLSLGYFLQGLDQTQDVFEAYHYAETMILPEIKKMGVDNITPAQLIIWNKAIHARIARTMADDYITQAGEYVQQATIRYRFGFEFRDEFLPALMPDLSMPDEQIQLFVTKYQIPEVNLRGLIDVYRLVFGMRDIPIPESERINLSTQAPDIVKAQTLIMNAYRNRLLSDEQMKLVKYFYKIRTPADELDNKMTEHYADLLRRWRETDKDDLTAIAKLGAYAFYQGTEIHPYFNCNGRTSTVMMNLIFASFDKRTILMRRVGERDDPHSLYSRAIKVVEDDPTLLEQHIIDRVCEVDQLEAYPTSSMQAVMTCRMQSRAKIIELLLQYPTLFSAANFKNYVEYLNAKILMLSSEENITTNDAVVRLAPEGMEALNKSEQEFIGLCKQPLKSALKQFTGCQWSVNGGPPLKAWYTVPNPQINDDNDINPIERWQLIENKAKTSAQKIIDKLNQTGLIKASLARNSKTKQFVVRIDHMVVDRFINTVNPATQLNQLALPF